MSGFTIKIDSSSARVNGIARSMQLIENESEKVDAFFEVRLASLSRGIQNSIETKQALLADRSQLILLERMAASIVEALRAGKKILFAGNGGSFSDSMHLATEFVSRFMRNRPALNAVALGTNSSNLSAIGNDYGYELVFQREIEAYGNRGDVFFAISTSGNSPNILRAVEAAKRKGLTVFGWSGKSGGKLGALCETLRIPSQDTARVQESHITVGHLLCEIAEAELFPKEV